MRALKVLQFICPVGLYGAERWVLALCNNLDRDRVRCDLAATREPSTGELEVLKLFPRAMGDTHEIPMRSRFDMRAVLRLRDLLRAGNYDVLHTHGYKSDILGVLAARLAGVACVSTPHGWGPIASRKMQFYFRMGGLALRYFDSVAPLSRQLVHEVEEMGVESNRVRFIRNGVDLLEIDAVQEAAAKAPGVRRIGFVGQLIARKRVGDIIEAFDVLYGEDRSLELCIVGDGDERSALEAVAASLACAKAVSFLGYRDDRLQLLRSFDVFVMASSSEGIPRCLMEALALRVPVVAYDIPGVDQLAIDGETGLLAPSGDRSALQSGMRRVLNEDGLAHRLGAGGRALVDEHFSAARMAREYETLFAEMVEARGSHTAGSRQK